MPKFSNWRNDLREVMDSDTPEQNVKEIKDKKGIHNKVIINPKISESIEKMGGELVDMRQIDEQGGLIDTVKSFVGLAKNPKMRVKTQGSPMGQAVTGLQKRAAANAAAMQSLNQETELEGEQLDELVGGAGTLVRQGVKIGGKKGGRAVQAGQKKAIQGGRAVQQKVKQGNPNKMVGDGKGEKVGAVVGGVGGALAGGILDGPLPVGDIVGGIAGSKVGGKIGRQFDKMGVKKEEFKTLDTLDDINEFIKFTDAKKRREALGPQDHTKWKVPLVDLGMSKDVDITKQGPGAVVKQLAKDKGAAALSAVGKVALPVAAGLAVKAAADKVMGHGKKKEQNVSETSNPLEKAWNKFVPPPSQSANPNVRSGKLKPGKLEGGALKTLNKGAAAVNAPIKATSGAVKQVGSAAKSINAIPGQITKGVEGVKGAISAAGKGVGGDIVKAGLGGAAILGAAHLAGKALSKKEEPKKEKENVDESQSLDEVKVTKFDPKEDKKKKIQQMLDRQLEWEKKKGKVAAGHATEEVVHEGKCDDCTCEGCGPDGVGHQNPCVECGGHHKEEKVSEAKVDTGKSADEKATARNQRNNPQKGDKGFGKFATSVFITRKLGEPLATGKDSAASRKRREAHAAKRGVKKEGYQHNPEKGEEEERKAEKARKESGRMPPRGDKRREDFEKWYAANVKEEVISEKDLSAKERRALPNKDFALPGKGEGPQGKQAGSYPIPDEKHARSALSLVSQHGTPEEKAKVRAKVKKKFPGIQVNEADDKAFKNVVGMLQKKYGKDSVITKDSPKPKAQSKAKPKPQKPLSDKEKAQREVDARYGRTAWNKKGSLGT